MRTQRELYTEKRTVYPCELDQCPQCGQPLTIAYTSGWKTVQTMSEVVAIAQCPKRCRQTTCPQNKRLLRSTRWQQIAPLSCTYGYDVIVQIGWQRQIQRQTFSEIHLDLSARMQISETQVRAIYTYRYLPLLACQERLQMEQLKTIAHPNGLWLSLDGLAPEGGEAQLWLVREIRSGHTLRCGWMSQQDQVAFVNFLQPIAKLGFPVSAVMSDKQRGLVPAVAEVFSDARHLFCQTHYLSNAAEPLSAADEAMKITLRQEVRQAVGALIRQEKVENQGVLTVTGGIPSPITPVRADATPQSEPAPTKPAPISPASDEDAILQDLSRRIRYLLTLKGRPPFCLAGIEMFERLTEVKDCLERLNMRRAHPQLEQLQQGVRLALQIVKTDYALLRQAADWLKQIADLLDPENKPLRSGKQVRKSLFAYLKKIETISAKQPGLQPFFQAIQKTTCSYAPGLFHSYDMSGMPRTNNARESDFRDLNRRLLRTTGQKGLTRRIIQRSGAWELLHRPKSLQNTILAFNRIAHQDFIEERARLCQHRNRFRLHTRSAKLSRLQLAKLEQRWANLAPN